MNSLYDKLLKEIENSSRQRLLDIVKEHFNFDEEEIQKWLKHTKLILLEIFKTEYTHESYTMDSNLNECINNLETFKNGRINPVLLHKLIGICASTTNLFELCLEEDIFTNAIKSLIPILNKQKEKNYTYLLECYFLNKDEIDFMVNSAPLMLLTFPNLNYYLQYHNYEIKRSENKRKIKDGFSVFKHYVYRYYRITTKTKKLSLNQSKKIIFDYAYTEMYEESEKQSYFAY